MTEAQKCLHHIAENMRMDKSISKEGYEYFQQAIKALEQESKTGHWINLKDIYGDIVESVCSNCDHNGNYKWKYCPNCGAKMESEEV